MTKEELTKEELQDLENELQTKRDQVEGEIAGMQEYLEEELGVIEKQFLMTVSHRREMEARNAKDLEIVKTKHKELIESYSEEEQDLVFENIRRGFPMDGDTQAIYVWKMENKFPSYEVQATLKQFIDYLLENKINSVHVPRPSQIKRIIL